MSLGLRRKLARLRNWLLATEIADREVDELEAEEWFREQLRLEREGYPAISYRSAGERGAKSNRRRKWSRKRIIKAIERWLTLLTPFALLATALVKLIASLI